jgi:3-hydroxypropanoate dehydrogenase
MTARLPDAALDQLFRTARSHNGWRSDPPLPEATLRELYELARFGPTAANTNPARFVFVTSPEAKEKLASVSSGNNQAKIKAAPATVIIGQDLDFAEHLATLFPHAPGMKAVFADQAVAEITAFRNSSLQGAYFIVAARALGLDTGPMSGFDNAKVDALFFPGTRIKSNFICSIGHGSGENQFDRLPRLSFEDACQIV